MALIKCKECGKEISDAAEKCPHCGDRTARGKNIEETKRYQIRCCIAMATIIIGSILFFVNVVDFLDLIEYLDRYKYFHDEDKAVVWLFVLGCIFMISGFIDVCCTGYEFKNMVHGVGSMTATENRTTWECGRCYSMNASHSSSCTRCGANRGGVRSNAQDTIPTWKRIQMEEREKTE